MLQAARIDGLVSLTGVALLFAIMWIIAGVPDRRSVALSAGAFGLGLVPGVVLGFADVSLRSSQYIHDLHGNVRQLEMAMIASIIFGFIVVVVVPPIVRRAPRHPNVSSVIHSA